MRIGPPGGPVPGGMGDRIIGMVRSMDANQDGKFDLNELPNHRRGFARMMLQRAGFDPEKTIDLKKIEQKVRERYGGSGGPGAEDGEPPLVPGFGVTSSAGSPPVAFGVRVESEEEKEDDAPRRRRDERRRQADRRRKIESYAKSFFEKNDRNKNRLLEKHEDEWNHLRGDPEEIDRNNDKRITLNELIVSMNGDPVPDTSPFPKGSFRFLTYYERMPEGVPDWFLERDQNRNAQLEMFEYADDWNRAAAEEFTFLDRNNDGVVTVEECFTTLREVEEQEKEAEESDRPREGGEGPPSLPGRDQPDQNGPRAEVVHGHPGQVTHKVIEREDGSRMTIVRPSGASPSIQRSEGRSRMMRPGGGDRDPRGSSSKGR